MTREELEERAEEMGIPLMFADGFDEAIIGLANYRGYHQVVYSMEKCIEILDREIQDMDCSHEFYFVNVQGAWVGDYTPIFVETEGIY